MVANIKNGPMRTLASIVGADVNGKGGTAPWTIGNASNGEYLLQNNLSGLNTLIVENLNATGFSALVGRYIDATYPSTGQSSYGSYEHFAVGGGQSLSLNGTPGLNCVESSRFPGAQNAAFPPTTFAIQQTGGVFLNPNQARVSCTSGQNTITLNAGGNFPAGVNGQTIRELGQTFDFPSGTTIVSGQGTATLTLSNNALGTNGFLGIVYGTMTAGQYNAAVFRDQTSIDFYGWATGATANPTNPYLKLDRINNRVGIGNLANDTTPIGSLDVIGQAWFGSDNTSARNTTFANGVINIIDTGTRGFEWLKTGVNTYRITWNATPSRIDHIDVNGSKTPLSIRMDGTGSVAFGGPAILKGATVATLPAGPGTGGLYYVTDATAPTFLGTLTGGGAVTTPVFYNGSAWVSG